MSGIDKYDPEEEGRIPEILEHYPLPTPYRVGLLGVGAKSRAYLVEPEADATARVLKLYGEGCRTRRQIEAELHLMCLLVERGLPVVQPYARRDGSHVTDFAGRSGARHAVLMTRAPGEVVPRVKPEQARHIGRSLARFHVATRGLEEVQEIRAPAPPDKKWWTTHLDLSKPISRIAALLGSEDRHAVSEAVQEGLHGFLLDLRELEIRLRSLTARMGVGLCHGAFHFGNFALEGETVTLFDLEAQCVAYQVTDIAIILCDIAQEIHYLRKDGLTEDDPLLLERKDDASRSGLALLEGYESERRLDEAERGCLLSHAPLSLAIHVGELVRPGAPPLAQSEPRIAMFLEEHASWNRLRRDLGWDHLDRLS